MQPKKYSGAQKISVQEKKVEREKVSGEVKLKERSKKMGCLINSNAGARVGGRAQAGFVASDKLRLKPGRLHEKVNVTGEFELKERSKK